MFTRNNQIQFTHSFLIILFSATTVFSLAQSNKWTYKTSMPTGRTLLSASVLDGKIYVIGGAPNYSATAKVDMYDPITDTWTQKADMPTGRWSLGACSVDGLIYAIGGRAGTNSSSATEVYDPTTDTWTTKTQMQRSRTALASGVVGNKIYTMGGHITPNYTVLSTIEEYTPDVNSAVSEHIGSSAPHEFQLDQNYPNPFNPETTIPFQVNRSGHIVLKVFDLSGREISTLVYGTFQPGLYQASFQVDGLPTGIYLFRLASNNSSEIRRMTLIK
ncbi:kelch repeat-containing protein [bacterium]